MSEHGELLSEAGMDWEREVRGYNRQQVDNYVAWRAGQVRELESRLSSSLAEIEHLATRTSIQAGVGGSVNLLAHAPAATAQRRSKFPASLH